MENHYISNPAVDLGTKDYLGSLGLQRKLVEIVRGGEIGDVLLFLDHPPVFTVGRGKMADNYTGIEVIETERGGDVTYHGPGQLVIYPIINLEKNNIFDVKKFVKLTEDVVIRSLSDFGYVANVGNEPGIWVKGKKVASIGLAIRNKISFHGISINISPESLSGFSKIRPCGLESSVMGFVPLEREKLKESLKRSFDLLLHVFEEITVADFFHAIENPKLG